MASNFLLISCHDFTAAANDLYEYMARKKNTSVMVYPLPDGTFWARLSAQVRWTRKMLLKTLSADAAASDLHPRSTYRGTSSASAPWTFSTTSKSAMPWNGPTRWTGIADKLGEILFELISLVISFGIADKLGEILFELSLAISFG